jgi:Zn finger protein HypA/HybF involved in hydrogenase expression
MNAATDTEFDAAEAFALLGDETRVAILEALAGHADDPLSFAQLREAVGVEDSGRFNYHLGKLVGRFVEKREDGYQLTFAGSRVIGAVYEGTYAEGDDIEPVEVDADCQECGAPLELTYADERVRVGCSECENVDSEFGFPPGAVAGRDAEALPAVLTSHMVTMLDRLHAGFCTNCSGPVSPVFGREEDSVTVEFACDRCHSSATTSLASVLLTEPAVVAFHYDHGVDVRETLLWSLSWLTDGESEQVSESPLRYAVTGTIDGERLRVVVDDTLEVVETERSKA